MVEEFTLANIRKFFNGVDKSISLSGRLEVENSCKQIASRYKYNMRQNRHRVTGETINSIGAATSTNWSIGEAGAKHEFPAKWLEYGTKSHGPVTAPFLVFKTKAGNWVRTKFVKGITATHCLGQATQALMGGDQFGSRLAKMISRIGFRF